MGKVKGQMRVSEGTIPSGVKPVRGAREVALPQSAAAAATMHGSMPRADAAKTRSQSTRNAQYVLPVGDLAPLFVGVELLDVFLRRAGCGVVSSSLVASHTWCWRFAVGCARDPRRPVTVTPLRHTHFALHQNKLDPALETLSAGRLAAKHPGS